jgi:hypothetical protein
MKPVTFPNMEAAIDALAATIMERYAPEELAQVTATIMLKLTTYYSVEVDGSVTIRGSLLDDPECRF